MATGGSDAPFSPQKRDQRNNSCWFVCSEGATAEKALLRRNSSVGAQWKDDFHPWVLSRIPDIRFSRRHPPNPSFEAPNLGRRLPHPIHPKGTKEEDVSLSVLVGGLILGVRRTPCQHLSTIRRRCSRRKQVNLFLSRLPVFPASRFPALSNLLGGEIRLRIDRPPSQLWPPTWGRRWEPTTNNARRWKRENQRGNVK